MTATLTLENDALVLKCRYDARLVNGIKMLPVADRAFDPQRKTWRIAPAHGARIVGMLRDYLGENVDLPAVQMTRRREARMLEVKYIGMSKDRANGERAAFGWCDGDWTVIFPEAELRRWFGAAPLETAQDQTLYQILAIAATADEQTIKTAYRRLARQWHPDVCQEPNATAMFRSIQEAYELLSDAGKRARYDAGLLLAASMNQAPSRIRMPDPDNYRSPLRCGLIRATGFQQLGRFVVEAILAWDDIVNARGQVLSVSWKAGNDRFTEIWV